MFSLFLTLLLFEVGILLLLSNSASVSILLMLGAALLEGSLAVMIGGDSLLVLMGILVFVGGVFVVITFVVFSERFDFDKSFQSSNWWFILQTLLLVWNWEFLVPPNSPSIIVGEFLFTFFFVLIVLLNALYGIYHLITT